MTPPLVLAAHGSTDPGFAAVVERLADQVRAHTQAPVVTGYLSNGTPSVAEAAMPGGVVVPLLLTTGFHVTTDIPAQAPHCRVTRAVGPDPRLAGVLAERLRAAGWQRSQRVVLAAAGSTDPAAVADARTAADLLSEDLGVIVTVAFLSSGEPRLADLDVSDAAVATYLLGPGRFASAVAGCGAAVIAAPLGAHPAIAEIVIDRYAEALALTA